MLLGQGEVVVGDAAALRVENLVARLQRRVEPVASFLAIEVFDFGIQQRLLAGVEIVVIDFLEHSVTGDFGAEVEILYDQRS